MRIEQVSAESKHLFIDYSRKYRDQLDDSFLIDSELDTFEPNHENPSYLLFNENNTVIGAVSLIIDDYFLSGKRGRFRIFHSVLIDQSVYQIMLDEILKHTEAIDRIFLFIKEEQNTLRALMSSLGFTIERYAYLMTRGDLAVSKPVFPEEFTLKTFEFNQDEEAYCFVRNTSFKTLKGSETPVTPDQVNKMKNSDDYIEGGIQLLYDRDHPIGLVRVAKEEIENVIHASIGPIAIIPEYQGKGLGRMLLRQGLIIGREKGYSKSCLSVNADNKRAVEIYLKEGFIKSEAFVCYNFDLISSRRG